MFALIGDVFRALRIKPSLASDPYWQLGARRRGVRAVFVPTCVIGFISATQTELTAAFSWVLSQGPPVLHTRLLFYYLDGNKGNGWDGRVASGNVVTSLFALSYFLGGYFEPQFSAKLPGFSARGYLFSLYRDTRTV